MAGEVSEAVREVLRDAQSRRTMQLSPELRAYLHQAHVETYRQGVEDGRAGHIGGGPLVLAAACAISGALVGSIITALVLL